LREEQQLTLTSDLHELFGAGDVLGAIWTA
jgi:hypothetical protein